MCITVLRVWYSVSYVLLYYALNDALYEFNDASLVYRISSSLYYNLTTRFIHIICTILFYQISFGQELVTN